MRAADEHIPVVESERLSTVRRYDILDTPPDGAFDRITAIAARRFSVPISIISIVDRDRIWFKSRHGLDVEQVGRDPGLCASAILGDQPWIIRDAAQDLRALANPLVAGDFGLRFYLGVPLRTWDGYNLGTLCVIDRKPRAVEPHEIEDLEDLASVVMDQLELRLSARRAVHHAQVLAKEIEHRVMNSLQFVSSMLKLQARNAGSIELTEQLRNAAERVATVARVHRHFQSSEISDQVSCLAYVRKLCAELSEVLQKNIQTNGVETVVDSKQVQSIGLIVNELVTNAAKQGAEQIVVVLERPAEGSLSIAVMDDGEGLPPNFHPSATTGGVGMKLVDALCQQLHGRLSANNNSTGCGACFTVTFPV